MPNKSTGQASVDRHRSIRLTEVIQLEWLNTDPMITTAPRGRIVRIKAVLTTDHPSMFPYGLQSLASTCTRYTQQLFVGSASTDQASDLCTLEVLQARHFVNMVSIHTLPEDDASSTWSSTRSVPTKVLHPEDDGHGLDFTPYPPSLMSTMMDQRLMVRPTTKGNSASSIMMIGLRVGHTKRKNIKEGYTPKTSTTPSTWWGTNKYSRPQAPMWLSLWQT